MTNTFDTNQLRSDLLKKVKKEFDQHKSNSSILRVKVKTPFIPPLKWLSFQSDKTQIFFSGRDSSDETIAATGITDLVQLSETDDQDKVLTKINTSLNGTKLKYFGGISFPEKTIGREWGSFGTLKFVIPKFEVIRKEEDTYFAYNFVYTKNLNKTLKELEEGFDKLNFNLKQFKLEIEKPQSIISIPDYAQWVKNVINITNTINSKKYNKIVLARKKDYEFKNIANPAAILMNLKEALFSRYNFMFQFEKEAAFIGSSMERLYKRSGRKIQSEGIAGSIERGLDEASDKVKSDLLINSKKDNHEQDFVVNFIQKKLSVLCEQLNYSKKEILKLKESFHLKSLFTGHLKKDITDIDIINSLHPTPAVGGSPWAVTSDLFSQYEPFHRGWYAGLVGYIGEDSADFSVALRSGLIYNNTLSLYAGVGIVQGSEPEKEWEEGNWKIKNYEEIFA